ANKAPLAISEEQLTLIDEFNSIFAKFKRDAQVDWIENFFAKWNAAEIDDQKSTLYFQLVNPAFQEKYQLTNDDLKLMFTRNLQMLSSENTAKIELTPYDINRIFLHAITVPPEEWEQTPLFFECFSEVYQFASNGFENSENLFI